MARALRILNPHPPITGTPSFRRLSQLPSPAYSPFSGGKSSAAPLLWKLRSVSRTRSIRASAESLQVPCRISLKFHWIPRLWENSSTQHFNVEDNVFARCEQKYIVGVFQGNGNGENRLPQVVSPNWTKSLARFAADNFLPLGMVHVTYTCEHFLSISWLSILSGSGRVIILQFCDSEIVLAFEL